MAAVTICSALEPKKNEVCHCFHCLSIYLPRSDGAGCHDLSFLNVDFIYLFIYLNVDFKVNSFTLLFHFHQEVL